MKQDFNRSNIGNLTRKGLINIIWFLIIKMVGFAILVAIAIPSIIISSRVLKGKSRNVLVPGVLALVSGYLIAGIIILIGNNVDKRNIQLDDKKA